MSDRFVPMAQWGPIDPAAVSKHVKIVDFAPRLVEDLGPGFGLPTEYQAAFNQMISETITKERDAVTALQALAQVTGDTRGVEVTWTTELNGDRAEARFTARLSEDVPTGEVRQRSQYDTGDR